MTGYKNGKREAKYSSCSEFIYGIPLNSFSSTVFVRECSINSFAVTVSPGHRFCFRVDVTFTKLSITLEIYLFSWEVAQDCRQG